jgi:hypothetical protein
MLQQLRSIDSLPRPHLVQTPRPQIVGAAAQAQVAQPRRLRLALAYFETRLAAQALGGPAWVGGGIEWGVGTGLLERLAQSYVRDAWHLGAAAAVAQSTALAQRAEPSVSL